MSFTFLAPLFLVGALAIAVPVFVHLTHRERKDVIPFPSLMFLRRVPYRTVRRQRIRHWLLLLLRTLAILLLVAAFARPFLDRASLATTVVGDSREIVVLLDRSASMGYGRRWDRGIAAAREVVDGLRPEDRATLVLFADRAEAVTQPTNDRVALEAVLNDARPLSVGTRYAPAVQLARDLLDASELPKREVVLITDFQRIAWSADAAVRMPSGTMVSSVDLSASDPENVAVTGVQLDRTGSDGSRLVVTARIIAPSGDAATEVGAYLEIEDQMVGTRQVVVSGGDAVTTTFAPVQLPERTVIGRVRIDADGLPHDDVFGFTVEPRADVPLLLLHHPNARPGELLYLRQALAIGTAPPFGLRVAPVMAMPPENLEDRAAIVLYDAPFPGGTAGRRLRDFVESGGGLFVVLGPRSGEAAWSPEATTLLADSPGPTVDRDTRAGGTLSVLDYRHPVFESFGTARGADFSSARFLRYRRWTPPDGAVVLARFDDGAPALVELAAGDGRVLVWTAGAANVWNDLPLHPVFLPFVHELARYVSAYRPSSAWRVAGTVLDLAADLPLRTWGASGTVFGPEPGELIVETPSGNRSAFDAATGYRLELLEHGFYTIRSADDGPTTRLAVNTEPAESDLRSIASELVTAALVPTEAGGGSRVAQLAATLTPAEKERRQALWWYVLMAALLLLVAEAVVAGRLSGAFFRRRTAETRNATAVR